jgi:hypothetical protein
VESNEELLSKLNFVDMHLDEESYEIEKINPVKKLSEALFPNKLNRRNTRGYTYRKTIY